MARERPFGRDTVILFGALLLSLSVVAFVPPSGGPTTAMPPRSAAGGTHATSSGPTGRTTPSPSTRRHAATTGGTGTKTSSGSNRVKLANTKYARFAYLISGRTLSSKAKRALDGFTRNRTRLNASAVRVTLSPTESRYRPYSVVLTNGEKLYFIEVSLGDDAPNRETQLSDDRAVLVDSNGYVVN